MMHQLCCQGKSNEKELGLFILGVAADSAGGEFKIFLKPFMSIFHSALQDSNINSTYYAGIALKNLIPRIGTKEAIRFNSSKLQDELKIIKWFPLQQMIQPLIPKVLVVWNAIVIMN